MNKRASSVPIGIMTLGCALLWNAHAQKAVPIQGQLSSVLADLPGLAYVDQSISADEQRVAGMTDYVARAYRRDSIVAFTTFVSYYDRQTKGRTIHSPKNCLPGAGWEIVSSGAMRVTADGVANPINRYVLKNGSNTAVAYYWYQGRGRITASEYRVKWNLLRDAAMHGRTEEALVRLVIPVRGGLGRSEASVTLQAMQAVDAEANRLVARMMLDVDRVLPPVS